jgi:hypothetical protein
MNVQALRGLRRREEAQELLQRIGNVDDDFGDIAIYETGQAIDNANWQDASGHLKDAQRVPRPNKVMLKFLECAIAIEMNDFSQLPEACALANTVGREADALQLQARAAVGQQRLEIGGEVSFAN